MDYRRHSKASHWVAGNDLNIMEVQHLLGHEDLSTTMIYVDEVGPKDTGSLATLEDEKDAKLGKKWKTGDGKGSKQTLRGACGL